MKRNYLVISLFFIVFLTWVSLIQYSDAQIIAANSGSNQNNSSAQLTIVSGTLNIASITVNYQIRGGLILNATLDKDIKSFILELDGYNNTSSIDAYGPHYMELWIPHKLLDTPSGGNFTVSVNGQVVAADQMPENVEPRGIVIKYQEGINVISIMGTRTVYDLTSSGNSVQNQLGASGPPNTQNIQSANSSSNNPFSVELISTIIFAIVIIVAAMILVRSLVKKKARLKP